MSLVTSALTLWPVSLSGTHWSRSRVRWRGQIGLYLFTVYPHGSSDALPYAAMGSGSLTFSALETGYTEKLTMESAKVLVVRSILAGIQNDLGSGSSVDLCVITSTGTTYLRNHI